MRRFGLLAALMAWLVWAMPARAAPQAIVYLADGVDRVHALKALNRLGLDRVVLRDEQSLVEDLHVVPLVDRRAAQQCGGAGAHVDLASWRSRMRAARTRVQMLDLDGALAAFSALEADLACLDEVPTPGDLFHWLLGDAEAHLFEAQETDDPQQQAFQENEARHLLLQAASFGDDMVVPEDLAPEARTGLAEAREVLDRKPAARVRVAGPGGVVYWNGRPAQPVAFRVPPGTHLVQVRAGDRVAAVALVRVRAGDTVLVWAGPGLPRVGAGDVRAAIGVLATTGEARAFLAPGLDALSLGAPALLVTGDHERIRIWGTDGDHLLLRLVDPPEAPPRTVAGASDERDYALRLSAEGQWVLGLDDQPLVGFALGGRVGIASPLVLGFALDGLAAALPGIEPGPWPDRGLVGARLGVRWREPSRLVDLGVEGGAALPMRYAVGALPGGYLVFPLGGVVASLGLPPHGPAGVRVELGAGRVPDGWYFGGSLGAEIR